MKTIGIYKYDQQVYKDLAVRLKDLEISVKQLKDNQRDSDIDLYIYNIDSPEEFVVNTDRPFVIVSSLNDSKYLIKGHKLGALDYISKPFIDVERIVKRLQRIIENGNAAEIHVKNEQMNKVDKLIEIEIKRAHRGKYPLALALVVFEEKLGKEVLVRLIDKIKVVLRDSDSCMPYFEGSVLVVLPFTDKAGSIIVVRKIADLLNSINYKNYCLCSQYPDDGDTREQLIVNLGKSVDTRLLYKY